MPHLTLKFTDGCRAHAQCGQALKGKRSESTVSSKRKREDGDGREDGRATRVKLASSNNGTSTLQIVNVDPALTRRTVAEASKMLSNPNLLSMMRSAPELTMVPGDPIDEDTFIDIWDSIRIQVSNNPADNLHQVRAHPKLDKAESEHPDPVFYLQHDVGNSTPPNLHECQVGLLALLFRIRPSKFRPNPGPLMA
ncbi:hypothetical protein FRC06_010712, partial [Ceratobasidium sp. 370]